MYVWNEQILSKISWKIYALHFVFIRTLYSLVRFLCSYSGLSPPSSVPVRSIFTPMRVGHKLIEWQQRSYNRIVHLFLHERCEIICLFCEMFVNVCLPAWQPPSQPIDPSAQSKSFCILFVSAAVEAQMKRSNIRCRLSCFDTHRYTHTHTIREKMCIHAP